MQPPISKPTPTTGIPQATPAAAKEIPKPKEAK